MAGSVGDAPARSPNIVASRSSRLSASRQLTGLFDCSRLATSCRRNGATSDPVLSALDTGLTRTWSTAAGGSRRRSQGNIRKDIWCDSAKAMVYGRRQS